VLPLRPESRLAVYTQCLKCETVFKLSAEVLRAAGGQVRCGNCGEVFNALVRLAEDSTAFAVIESPLDLEARADSILETVVEPQVARAMAEDIDEYEPAGVEIAQLEVLPEQEQDQQDIDASMEFTLPPGELDRIFVESKTASAWPQPPPSEPTTTEPLPPEGVREAAQEPEHEAQHDGEAHSDYESQPDHEAQPYYEAHSDYEAQPDHEAQPDYEAQPDHEPEAWHELERAQEPEPPPHPESTQSGFEVSDAVRREMLAGFDEHIRSANVLATPRRRGSQRRAFVLWLSGAVVGGLLLIGQVVHHNREWFVTHPLGSFGGVVRALYTALGTPLPAPANLSAYQLRQWGVTGDPDASGTLRVRASILNTAPQLQPYPLLRVTLADRFGKRMGTREFEPGEYLAKPTARMMAPGERVDATLAILDPGKSAEGFEIDVCLRGVDRRISCANDVAPQSRR
jgi:predicted Zn finger-like uncharacterized protein